MCTCLGPKVEVVRVSPTLAHKMIPTPVAKQLISMMTHAYVVVIKCRITSTQSSYVFSFKLYRASGSSSSNPHPVFHLIQLDETPYRHSYPNPYFLITSDCYNSPSLSDHAYHNSSLAGNPCPDTISGLSSSDSCRSACLGEACRECGKLRQLLPRLHRRSQLCYRY